MAHIAPAVPSGLPVWVYFSVSIGVETMPGGPPTESCNGFVSLVSRMGKGVHQAHVQVQECKVIECD